MFPTLLERSALSQQIYAQYLSKFNEYIIPILIRVSIKGQVALLCQKPILEYAPTSSLAQEHYELILLLWQKV